MPAGKWQPPEAGDAPQEVKDILKEAYSAWRDKHPGENPATKAKGAKIAWGAVKNAGWHKNAEGKWMKKKKEMSEEEGEWITINGQHILLGSTQAESKGIYGNKQPNLIGDHWYPKEAGEGMGGEIKKIEPGDKGDAGIVTLKTGKSFTIDGYMKYMLGQHGEKLKIGDKLSVKYEGKKLVAGSMQTLKAYQVHVNGKKIPLPEIKVKKEMAEEIVIDAFKEGEYPQGKFGAKELFEIESTYDPQVYEAPILIGHLSDPSYKGKSAIPAFGWIGKVKVIGEHLKLVASQFSEELKDFIKKGFYKKVSAAFFEPQDANNPTPGKWHLHHLAFLGGAAPAVKGLEQIAFAEMKGLGIEFAEMDAEVTEDGELIGEIEDLGTEDTLKDLTEHCATFLSKAEDALAADIDTDTCRSRLSLATSDLNSEIYSCINSHFAFLEKLENIENGETEMSEKKTWLVQLSEAFQSIIHKRKESEMDAQKEQEYKTKITELEGTVGTLTAKVTQFEETKRQADEAAILATANAAKEAKKAEVKAFCETAMTEGRMTKAEREADEPRMFTLVDNPEALKSFQEGKYPKDRKAVPLGETDLGDKLAKPKGKLDLAADYVKAHPTEFAGLSPELAIARAVFRETNHEIQFK